LTVIVWRKDGGVEEHAYVDVVVHDNYLRLTSSDPYKIESWCYPFFAIERWEERER
jgi:hypothetical protein